MNPLVTILIGSDSDYEVMQTTVKTLAEYQIPCAIHISSAHRTPQATQDLVAQAEKNGCQIFIAAAGLSAHLAGVVAAHTTKPVIGVPLNSGSLQGLDSLLSTVNMPGGIPVATVAIGKAGAKNAAILAAQILALNDDNLARRLQSARESQRQMIAEKNANLQAALSA